jgi:HEAT repeat protein
MKRSFVCTTLAAAVLFAAVVPGLAADAVLDGAFKALGEYDWGKERKGLEPIDKAINASVGNAAVRADIEGHLIAVLKSDASRAAKDFACRKLAIMGTETSVPALATLLTSEELSHMGRYALERMPYESAVKAMRDALGKTSGRIRIGIINSLGNRADTGAAKVLVGLLADKDPATAGAAAAALGKLGTPEAAQALTGFKAKAAKELQAVTVDALLDVAARLVDKGNADEAVKIYQALDKPGEPQQVRMAAFQGVVMAQPAASAPKLIAALGGEDAMLRNQAAQLIAEAPGKDTTTVYAAALPKLPTAGQIALLGALATRGDVAARPVVLEAVKSQDKAVRSAAVAALATTGTAADVTLLAGLAASGDKDVDGTARVSLARLAGDDVNKAIAAAIAGAKPAVRAELLGALASRNAKDAIGTVVGQIGDADATVRSAALTALAQLGTPEQTTVAVKAVRAAKDSRERGTAEKALLAICSRGREKSQDAVLAGLQGADAAVKGSLLRALGRIGGTTAMQTVQAATADKETSVSDDAVRVLAEWPDLAAAPHLLTIAKTSKKMNQQVLALRGYVRLAGVEKNGAKKMAMLTESMGLAQRPDEKKLVLGELGNIRTLESMKLIAPCLDDPKLANEAGTAAVRVGRDAAKKDRDLVIEAMTKVVATTRNNRTKRDAQKLLGDLKKQQQKKQ